MIDADPPNQRAADTLRSWALDEDLKRAVLAHPALARAARRVADRYVAGDTIADAVAAVRAAAVRGHAGSIEYAGESVRDESVANRETEVFVDLIESVGRAALPSTVSLDLSHIGSVVSFELGLANARRLAELAEALQVRLMVSAESSERTDLVLGIYDALSADFPSVGITLQARLHRSLNDLDRVVARPGVIRLVKGAFLDSESTALGRDSPELAERYLQFASVLVEAGHPVAFATHDASLVDLLVRAHGEVLKRPHVEFEMLLGLGTVLLDRLHRDGYATREYAIFGGEWWLYVLNRMAEHPERVIVALADLNRTEPQG